MKVSGAITFAAMVGLTALWLCVTRPNNDVLPNTSMNVVRTGLFMRGVTGGYEWLSSNAVFATKMVTVKGKVAITPMIGRIEDGLFHKVSFLASYCRDAQSVNWKILRHNSNRIVVSILSDYRPHISQAYSYHTYIADFKTESVSELTLSLPLYNLYETCSGTLVSLRKERQSLIMRDLSNKVLGTFPRPDFILGFTRGNELALLDFPTNRAQRLSVAATCYSLSNAARHKMEIEFGEDEFVTEATLSFDNAEILLTLVSPAPPNVPKQTAFWAVDLKTGRKRLIHRSKHTNISLLRTFEHRISVVTNEFLALLEN